MFKTSRNKRDLSDCRNNWCKSKARISGGRGYLRDHAFVVTLMKLQRPKKKSTNKLDALIVYWSI